MGFRFSGVNWRIEYRVEANAIDTTAGAETGGFLGAVTAGQVSLNNTVYRLSGASAAGNLFLSSYSGAYDGIFINPASGGFLQFINGQGATFPALFGDVNNLLTAHLGATLRDSTTDSFNNQSILGYGGCADDTRYPPTNKPCVVLADGNLLNIQEASGPASGKFAVTVSRNSLLSPPDPRAALQLLDLAVLLPTSNVSDHKTIQKAIDHLDRSLEIDLWNTDTSLAGNDGKKVFDELGQVVAALLKVRGSDVSATVLSLVDLNAKLAAGAIAEARSAFVGAACPNTTTKDCKKAAEELAKVVKDMDDAAAALSNVDYIKAINAYGKAWQRADKALKSLG